jgi:hypothetical protein
MEVVSNKWIKRFFWSHIFGWITATLQTCWIVYEVRRYCKQRSRHDVFTSKSKK